MSLCGVGVSNTASFYTVYLWNTVLVLPANLSCPFLIPHQLAPRKRKHCLYYVYVSYALLYVELIGPKRFLHSLLIGCLILPYIYAPRMRKSLGAENVNNNYPCATLTEPHISFTIYLR
jgi:hypothetical protein